MSLYRSNKNKILNTQEIKSKIAYEILKEFSTHIDNNGNYPPINWNIIFNSLVEKEIYKENEQPKFRRLVTDLSNPFNLLTKGIGSEYSLSSKGNVIIPAWAEEYEGKKVLTNIEKKRIKKLQDELEREINRYSEYQFSVFISHSFKDYEDIHKLLLTMISNKIKPEPWFMTVGEDVPEKLYKIIDESKFFLLYITENILDSQMTNNEIGFVEGKRYYNKIDDKLPEIVIRIYKSGFKLNNLSGFYTKAKDMIPFSPNNPEDIKKIIKTLKNKNKGENFGKYSFLNEPPQRMIDDQKKELKEKEKN